MIDNRKIETLVDELIIDTSTLTQGLIIEVCNGTETLYFNGTELDADIDKVKVFHNDDDSGILDIVKDLRKEGLNTRILDICIEDNELTIQDDITDNYITLKLI